LQERGKGGEVASENLLRPFLLAFFLYQFAMGGMLAYLSLHLKALGATPAFITYVWAIGVVCEALIMVRVGRWSDTWGRRPALVVAFCVLPVRLLLYAVAPAPWFVLGAQTLEGMNFGIIGPLSVVFVNDVAREGARGAAQARLAGVSGLAMALGPVAAGLVAGPTSLVVAFVALAVVAAGGRLGVCRARRRVTPGSVTRRPHERAATAPADRPPPSTAKQRDV
jgi:MFS family permease